MKPINVTVELNGEELKKKLNIKDGKTPVKGVDYRDGIDAEPVDIQSILNQLPTPEEVAQAIPLVGERVRDSLELLQGGDRLSIEAIKGLQEELSKTTDRKVTGLNKRLWQLIDVNLDGLAVDQSIKWDGTQWIPYTPSSGGGAVDSVNGQTGVVVLDTDDIADTATNRYTNDTDITRLANTSGTNTGDQDLSGYVPYTGATADVDLGAFNLNASTVSTNNGGSGFNLGSTSLTLDANTANEIQLNATGADQLTVAGGDGIGAILDVSGITSSQTFAFPDASGTVALTSDLSSYIPLIARPATDISSTGEYLIVDEPTNVTDASYSSVGTVIGQWDINGDTGATAIDDSTNANNGSYQGSLGQTDDANGIVGKYINLDGSNDYISIPNLAAYNAIPISWAFNIRIPNTAPASYDGLIEKYLTGSLNGYLIFLDTVGRVGFFYLRGSASNAINEGLLSQPIMDGAWHRVVVTLDSSGAEMFIDGVSVDTQAWTGTQGGVTTTETLKIGAHSSFSRYSLCAMDEIVVYSQKLNSTQALADAKIALQRKLMDGRGYYQIGNGGWGNIRLNAETLTLLDEFKIRNTTTNNENVIGLDTIDGADNQSAILASFDIPISGTWASRGSYFGMRGNEFTSYANQRGHLFFVAGNPGTAGTYDGGIAFYTGNEVVRMHIHRDGQIRMPIGTAASPSLAEHTDTNTGMSWLGSDVLTWSTAGTERMRLTALGYLGINTAAPRGYLDINSGSGNFVFAGMTYRNASTGYAQFDFHDKTANFQRWAFGATSPTYSDAAISGNNFWIYQGRNTAGSVVNLYRLVINDSGNIGIGISSPSAKTHIVSTTEQLRLGYNAANYTSFSVSASGKMTVTPSGGEMFLDVANNLGIGTTSPAQFVDMVKHQNAGTYYRVFNNDTGTAGISGAIITAQNANLQLLAHGGGRVATRYGVTLADATEFLSNTGASSLLIGTNAQNIPIIFGNNSVEIARFDTSQNLLFADSKNISFNTTTGTKIGTATTQKLGFWNAAPIVQPTTAVTAATFVANTSGIVDDTATFDGYTIGQVVKALRNAGLLA